MKPLSRRTFLADAFALGTYALPMMAKITPSSKKLEAKPARKTLNETEWRTLESMTSRIIPSDDEPGTRESDVVRFIDQALLKEERGKLKAYEQGLAAIDRLAEKHDGNSFFRLSEREQDAILEALDDGKADP